MSITIELSDSESSVLWSDAMNRRFDDIFEFQDRGSQQIIGTIAPHLREAEIRRVPASGRKSRCIRLLSARPRSRLPTRGASSSTQRRRSSSARSSWIRIRAAPYAYLAHLWYAIRIGQDGHRTARPTGTPPGTSPTEAVNRDRRDAASLALCGHVYAIQFRDFERALTLFEPRHRDQPELRDGMDALQPDLRLQRRLEGGPPPRAARPCDCRRWTVISSPRNPVSLAAYTGRPAPRRSTGATRRWRKIPSSRQTCACSARRWQPRAAATRRGRWRAGCWP